MLSFQNGLSITLLVLCLGCSQEVEKWVYQVRKVDQQKISIDGLGNEPAWERAVELTDFADHWSDEQVPSTSFKALWDDERIYFLYQVEDPQILLVEDSTRDVERQAVNSDRVEIFIRSSDVAKPYYALEMDALGRTFDSQGEFGEYIDWQWDWPAEDFNLKASIAGESYQVEGSLTLRSLRQLGLLVNGKLNAGLYRGEYIPSSTDKPRVRWISWVKPDSDKPNFHIPSSFGVLELTD